MSDERGSGPENPERGMIARTGETGQHEDEALELVEVAGRIKWFDVSKGFGFIVPDDGAPDILLHVTCLRRDGYQAASEGARIVVEAVERPRGWQAFRVISSIRRRRCIPPSCRCRARTSP